MADKPAHHAKNGFQNPWPSAGMPSLSELSSALIPVDWAKRHLHKHPKAEMIKVVQPDWGQSISDKQGAALCTWLGHAGVLVELQIDAKPVYLLFDPIFSYRAGPTKYTGPPRLNESPCQVKDLPGCHCVFISHNHYDHLDLSTIQGVIEHFPDTRYFVPLGNKKWFVDTGVPEENIFEMDWWDEATLSPEQLAGPIPPLKVDEPVLTSPSTKTEALKVACVPSQHNSGRGATDQGSTLWSGWVVEHLLTEPPSKEGDNKTARITRKAAIYHAGDTGYRRHPHSKDSCPAFREIGEKYGHFDVAFIPLWRGGSLSFVSWFGLFRVKHEKMPSALHGTPSDAVHIHLDVKSSTSLGMHFGTFVGDRSECLECIVELKEACEEMQVADYNDDASGENGRGRMGVIDIGQTARIKCEDVVHVV